MKISRQVDGMCLRLRLAVLTLCVNSLGMAGSLYLSKVYKVMPDWNVVAVTYDEPHLWKTGDDLCIFRKSTADNKRDKVACGQVRKITPKGVIIKLNYQSQFVFEGDQVQLEKGTQPQPVMAKKEESLNPVPPPAKIHEPEKPPSGKTETTVTNTPATLVQLDEGLLNRLVAETKKQIESLEAKVYHRYDISAGFNETFPIMTFRMALSRHYAIGLSLTYLNHDVYTVNTRSYGGFLSLNYFGYAPFRGVWLQLGAGVYGADLFFEGKDSFNLFFTSIGSLGWKWDLRDYSIGVGLGAQFFHLRKNQILPFDYIFFVPTFLVEMGLNFT